MKWTYWLQPIEQTYRIREEIDAGRNHRIVGFVFREDDAKAICDAHNASLSFQEQRGDSNVD